MMHQTGKAFDEKYDAVVIGGGVGGLTCGAYLARNGMAVKLFERSPAPGGYCTSFTRKGFKFDSAVMFVSGCGPGSEMGNLLSELGVISQLKLNKLEPLCNLIITGQSFVVPATMDGWVKSMVTDFPAEKAGITRLFDTARTIAIDMKKLPAASPVIARYRDSAFRQMLDEHITAPMLKAVITGIFFGGVPPSRFSALSWCAGMAGRFEGIYSVTGGAQQIADALAGALKGSGGSLELNTGVSRIMVEGGKAAGVETTDGRRVKADYVVSNAAAMQTFGGLISRREMTALCPDFNDKLRRLEISTSGMSVFLGVDADIRSLGVTIPLTIVHDALDVEEEWEAASQGRLADSFLSFVVPTLADASGLAPPGKHTIHTFTVAPYNLPGTDWNRDEKKRLTDVVIGRLERVIPGLSRHIVVRDSATPRTQERYTLNTGGALIGWARSPGNLPSAPGNKTPIDRLYLAGHWTSYGGGIRSCAMSGRAAARAVLGDVSGKAL